MSPVIKTSKTVIWGFYFSQTLHYFNKGAAFLVTSFGNGGGSSPVGNEGEGRSACLWKTRSQIKLEPQAEEAEGEGPCLEGWRTGSTTQAPTGDWGGPVVLGVLAFSPTTAEHYDLSANLCAQHSVLVPTGLVFLLRWMDPVSRCPVSRGLSEPSPYHLNELNLPSHQPFSDFPRQPQSSPPAQHLIPS